jgi:hypothetical protein
MHDENSYSDISMGETLHSLAQKNPLAVGFGSCCCSCSCSAAVFVSEANVD